jgi:hypothetical protein
VPAGKLTLLRHRETRDLDLFFRAQRSLGDVVDLVRQRLEADGLTVTAIRTAPMFGQLDVRSNDGAVVVDLVADPTPVAEAPEPRTLEGVTILVDTVHQLLVNKLCALLSRSELRDLVDVRVLVEAGGDLSRALADSPDQDAGFSPLTFAWSVRNLPIRRLANALGWPEPEIDALEQFRETLVDRVVAEARPT